MSVQQTMSGMDGMSAALMGWGRTSAYQIVPLLQGSTNERQESALLLHRISRGDHQLHGISMQVYTAVCTYLHWHVGQ